MQNGDSQNRITQAAHQRKRSLPLTSEQIIVRDLRLRSWITAVSAPSYSAPDTTFELVSDAELGDGIQKDSAFWDMGYHDLGANAPVELPNGTNHPSGVSSVEIVGETHETHLVCFYANGFRKRLATGIYVVRVIDDGAGHLYWGDPKRIFGALGVDASNRESQMFVTFPRIQVVGDEFWIIAMEVSAFAGHQRYHLCYFRSKDGAHWSDRQYLAGVSEDSDNTRGIYKYDTNTPFVLDDLLDAYLEVDGNTVYLVSPEAAFQTDATLLVGVDNPAKKLDVTPYVTDWSLSVSRAPSAWSGDTQLRNPGNVLAMGGVGDIIRRGAQITRKAGYKTSEGMEFVTLATETIDEDPRKLEVGKQDVTLQSRNGFKLLQTAKMDAYYEYPDPQQLILMDFCDYSMLNVMHGAFRIQNNARLWAAPQPEDAEYPDNLAFVSFNRGTDGAFEFQFRQFEAWVGRYVGIAFGGQNEKTYWAVTYNKHNSNKFQLRRVTRYPGRSQRKLKYYAPVAESDTIVLGVLQKYWFRVQQWHGHVHFAYSQNHVDWATVIDYVSPDAPANEIVNADSGYFGLIGTSQHQPSGPVGNNAASAGPYLLADDSGRAALAIRIHTGAYRGYIRHIGVLLTQENLPPDMLVRVLFDSDGTGAAPPDATNEENVLYAKRVNAKEFDSRDASTIHGVGITVPGNIRTEPDSYYWLMVYPVADLTGDQAWHWYSIDPEANTYGANLTRVSDDGGATWESLADTDQNLTAFVDIDYDLGTTRFRQMNAAYGTMPHTMEDVALDIAAKGGILQGVVADLPASVPIGDCWVEADVTLSGTARVHLRGANGYKVEFHPDNQRIRFYSNGVTIGVAKSLQYFEEGTPFHLTIAHHKDVIYVYINRCLATIWFILEDERVTDVGFPTNSGNGTFDNFRVPDLHRIQEYFALEVDQTPADGLNELTQKKRVTYFVDYANRLHIGSFRGRSVVDTYDETVITQGEGTNDTDWASQLSPQGEYVATRFDAELLDSDGRRYAHEDFTDAFTDEQAWEDGALFLARAREMANTGELTSPAVPTLELEDVIADGNGKEWIVSDIQFQRSSVAQFTQTAGVRRFVPMDDDIEVNDNDLLIGDDNDWLVDDQGDLLEDDD